MRSLLDFFRRKSIHVGNLTIHERLGELVIRKKKNKKSKKNKKGTEKQSIWRNLFGGTRRFYKLYNEVMSECPIWALFVEWVLHRGRTGDNIFTMFNILYMDGNSVGCPAMFHFSVGKLGMPWDMAVERHGDVVTFTWHDQRNIPRVRPTDRLKIGILYDEHRDRPSLHVTNVTRADGCTSIVLDPRYGSRVHLYPFFESAKKKAYSWDQHFEI